MPEPPPFTSSPILDARNIQKRFGNVHALNGADLTLWPGEVHALLGENGAGKSTLMNVLYGLLSPDDGQLVLNGKSVRFTSPRAARDAGIGMVHQHFTLVPTLTVAENLALGKPTGIYRPAEGARRVTELCRKVGLEVDPHTPVSELSVGLQQRVEILKALSNDARILILDEPTGVLAPQEVDGLLAFMRRLASEGVAVVFITHKLEEVAKVADRVTVLRRGERVLVGPASQFSTHEMARAMIGEDLPSLLSSVEETAAHPQEAQVALSISNLTVHDDQGRPRVHGVTFDLHEGEVLGLAGVEGSGQTELAEAITGLRSTVSGTIQVFGDSGTAMNLSRAEPADYIRAGGAHIPEDRRRTGLVLEMPIWENLILESHRRPPLRRSIWLDRRRARRDGETLVAEYEVRTPSIDTPAAALSGGNQQKVVIAREMSRHPWLLVAVNPTRGLDVRATAYVHTKIREHRERGGATLLISSELNELYALSNRIGVMHGGRLAALLPPSIPREELGLWMTRGAAE